MIKKAGIVCDNYKVKKFKKELEKADFNDLEVAAGKTITNIQVKCDDSRFKELEKLCKNVELYFKRSN